MKTKINISLIVFLLFTLILSACGTEGNDFDQIVPDGSENIPPLAAVKAREALAKELGIGIDKVEIISQQQTEWMDSCLGLGGAAESCLQVIVPGWRVELAVDGKRIIAHTDELGDAIRFE